MTDISLGRVTTLLLAGRAAGYALSLVNAVVLARTLGADRLGAYAYAMGIAGVFGLLPNLGISTVVTRAIAREPEAGAAVLGAALRAQALLAGGVLLVIPAFAAILPVQPVPLWYVGLAAAQLAVGTLSWPYLAVLGGRARYDRLALAELVVGAAGTTAVLGAAVFGGGVAAFLWAHLVAAAFAVLAARRVAAPFTPHGGGERLGLGALFRQAAPLGATAAMQSVYTRLDVVMLGQMAPRAVLGLYSAAYRPINLAVFFGNTVSGTLLPLMSQAAHGTPAAFVRAVRSLGAAGPAMALALSGLAAPLLGLLFGAEYEAAAPILVVLAWSAAANWLYGPLAISLQARRQERWWLVAMIAGTLLNAGGNLWAIPRWGGVGAAGATLASEAALLLLGVVLAWRVLSLPPPGRRILAVLAATAAGAFVLVTLRSLGSLPATGAALFVYGVLLILFRIVGAEDARVMLGWLKQATAGSSRG